MRVRLVVVGDRFFVGRNHYAVFQRDVLFLRPVTTDGVQDVYVQFIDHAGNASAVVGCSF